MTELSTQNLQPSAHEPTIRPVDGGFVRLNTLPANSPRPGQSSGTGEGPGVREGARRQYDCLFIRAGYVKQADGADSAWVDFRVWPGSILYIDSSDEPQSGEHARIWYTKAHTLNGLNAASTTTLPADDIAFLISGAAALAARFRAAEIAEEAAVDRDVFTRLQEWADKMIREFNEGLSLRAEKHAQRAYTQEELDESIRQAIEQYSRVRPGHAIGAIDLAADSREISLASLTNLVRVEKVWWDYDSTSPGYPPNYRHFEVWPGSILYINDTSEPQSGDVVRVWYTQEHTLSGLDSASTTTFPIDDEVFILDGAAAFAAHFRTARGSGPAGLGAWADKMMAEFNAGLRIRDWRSYVFTHDQDDIDEAIRWALGRYTEISPDHTITTLDLAADGREVDISSITDYLHITRVWWDYDSTDPTYPPEWRDFELWPGNILYIKDGDEPVTGDTVRVWYTRVRTLNGLDSASTTTLPVEHENLIVVGASGFAAQERVQDEEKRYVPRKLREWADARLAEFERGLTLVARQLAARHSGIAKTATLDRWDDQW
ncbi:MAG: hypothetical protein JXM73_14220 [Anaerolineae bacterium]|nr:hypothetical protein [Anaerolineae bacterium]